MAKLAIIGGGPAGKLAALALAGARHEVALIGPSAPGADKRTTAIMAPGLRFLKELDLLPDLESGSAPLKVMRIIDGTKRLFRSPTVSFHAQEMGEEAFGLNVPNALLNLVSANAMVKNGVSLIDANVAKIEQKEAAVFLTLENGSELQFEAVIGADGQHSVCRQAAGIATRQTALPQCAIVGAFAHTRHHGFISTEFHTESGPCTSVPLPGGYRSSFVWVVSTEQAADLQQMPLSVFSRALETRMASILGAVTVDETIGVQSWPLTGVLAEKSANGRIALIGEAAHRFPPIGAQGLNLTIRDIVELRRVLAENSDPTTAFAAFASNRANDVHLRYSSVMALNRSLLFDWIPVQLLRKTGLSVLSQIPALRGFAMQEGMEPGSGWKRIFSSKPTDRSNGQNA